MKLLDYDDETGAFRAQGTRTEARLIDAGSGWSATELDACVRAYRELWLAQQAGDRVNKSALRRKVVQKALPGRTEGAYEFRMRNISALVEELGLSRVQGYLPLKNVGAPKADLIESINRAWKRKDKLEGPTADPTELATRVISASQKLNQHDASVPPGSQAPPRVTAGSRLFLRDPNVIAWTLRAAKGFCEACGNPAPF